MRIHSVWDIQRDELVQVVIWCNSTGLENRVFELRYGDIVGSLEVLKDLEAFVCFCGCGIGRQEDIHVKHFRYIKNECKGFTPFIYLDFSSRTKEEMEKYIKDSSVEIRAIDLCVLKRPYPLRFSHSKDHTNWYASVEVLFLFIEWSSRKVFHATYRINPLDLTVKLVRIARLKDEDRKRLAVTHTHECARISSDLPLKHYPKWNCMDQSLSRIVLEELNVEIKLDYLPRWYQDRRELMEILEDYFDTASDLTGSSGPASGPVIISARMPWDLDGG
ncbi:hypothetical protein ABW19_dt0210432 [Dactylella cylindrospora]|nr:hypothetical protein ABW19_dt0210432 [Dactylella cylindrospora]